MATPQSAEQPTPRSDTQLELPTILTYAAPTVGAGFMFFLPLATAALAWLVHALPRLFAGLQERSMIAGVARPAGA